MNKIKLTPYALSPGYSSSRSYALILAEKEGPRKLLIMIGEMEAQIIALELEGIKPPRPLTHDLITTITEQFGITPTEVFIDGFFEGIFSSKIFLEDAAKTIKVLDSRTSDAIILALKYKIPIYTSVQIMESVGIVLTHLPEEEDKSAEVLKKDTENDISTMPIGRLEELLKEAEAKEEYEKASLIMKEISKRKKKKKTK